MNGLMSHPWGRGYSNKLLMGRCKDHVLVLKPLIGDYKTPERFESFWWPFFYKEAGGQGGGGGGGVESRQVVCCVFLNPVKATVITPTVVILN